MSKEIEEKWKRVTEESVLKGDLAYWRRIDLQIGLIQTAPDYDVKNERILDLVDMIPPHWIDEEFERELEECQRVFERWQYAYTCSRPIGTPENPAVLNDPSDWDYDPSKPTVPWSPVRVKDIETDYRRMFRACLSLFNRRRRLETTRFVEFNPESEGETVE